MNVRYVVELSEAERTELRELVAKGSKLARKVKRAQVLLAADGGVSDLSYDVAAMGQHHGHAGIDARFLSWPFAEREARLE